MCKEECKQIKSFVSTAIVLAVLIFVFFLGFSWHFNRVKEPFPQTIKVSVSYLDSLKTHNVYESSSIDSLIGAVHEYDRRLEERYKYLVEHNEIDSHRNSYLELLLTLLGCVLAFFGISSFADIKNKAKNTAKEVAKNTATKTSKKITEEQWEDYKNIKIKEELNNLFRDQFNQVISDTLSESFEAFKQSIQEQLEHLYEDVTEAKFGLELIQNEMKRSIDSSKDASDQPDQTEDKDDDADKPDDEPQFD